MKPLEDVRDISRIAYGFMASKALFAALNLDLFGHIANTPLTAAQIAAKTGVAPGRITTLLAGLTALGLVVTDGTTYGNAPASARYLVRSSPTYFGDYYRFQIDRLIYPSLEHLDAGLRGELGGRPDAFENLDPARADEFTSGQHSGSMGPAVLLTRRLDLSACRSLLDVAGGSGAFSIALCRKFPALTATLIDFPNITAIAARFIGEASLSSRIRLVPSDALTVNWPEGQDVVLMSYLLSAIDGEQIPVLIDRARRALKPGGLLVIHDFMLDDTGHAPALAALWFLQYVAWEAGTVSFSAEQLGAMLKGRGFTGLQSYDLIHEITRVVTARAPAS
jgi:2-hydroxy-4-(methylsulfanyl)butanoate S-methyltransferase